VATLAPRLKTGSLRFGDDLNSFFPVEIVQKGGQVGREHPAPDSFVGEDHRDLLAVHRQCGGNLGANESATNHSESRALFRESPEAFVIGQHAKVNNMIAAERQSFRHAAGREQQFVEGVDSALVVR
jgi:hypothetical protein